MSGSFLRHATRENDSGPEVDEYVIAAPEHLLGDDGQRERLVEHMQYLYPGTTFRIGGRLPFYVQDFDLIPVMGKAGSDDRVLLCRRPAEALVAEMVATMKRFSRGSKGLH